MKIQKMKNTIFNDPLDLEKCKMLEKPSDRLLFAPFFDFPNFCPPKHSKSDPILTIPFGKQVAQSTWFWILLKMKKRFFSHG